MEREDTMTRVNHTLHLPKWLKAEAERLAKQEGTTLDQLINVAVAEKLAALRAPDYVRERTARAGRVDASAMPELAGTHEPPRTGDELEEPRLAGGS
jgi:hypothetical protein